MADSNSIAKPDVTPTFRDLIATRIDRQYNRVYQVQGTVQVLMEIIERHYCTSEEGERKYTPICSALTLVVDTLGDIADHIEPGVVLASEVAHV
jgi:hypothetical protein